MFNLPIALLFVLLQVSLFQVYANPSIVSPSSSSSSPKISSENVASSSLSSSIEINDVTRLKESPGGNPFEKILLEYMETNGLVDDSKRHVKYLLNEQESFDFTTRLSAVDILYRSKFEYQVVNVTSEDGYITQMIRIINPLVPTKHRKSPPVVLYAGQGVSVDVFLIASLGSHSPTKWPLEEDFPNKLNAAKRSLAITLANNGYDVWLVGTRGTDEANCGRVSQDNNDGAVATVKLPVAPIAQLPTNDSSLSSPSSDSKQFSLSDSKSALIDEKFLIKLLASTDETQLQQRGQQFRQLSNGYWSFSHDEIIHYEFKLQLDTILAHCKHEKLSLITYSNGGFIAYAFAAAYPEYSLRHIDTMINLAPAVFINKGNLVVGKAGLLSALTKQQNAPIIDQNLDSFARGLWFKVCNSRVLRYTVCKFALNLLYGFSDNYQTHFELKLLDYIGKPMSSSGFRQTLQCSYANRLQHYDYGLIGNLNKYKQMLPPIYDLKQVNLPRVFILTGELDSIVDTQSVSKLIGDCSQPPAKHLTIPGYNHLDIIAGWDVDYRINTPVLNILDDRCLELSSSNHLIRNNNNNGNDERVHPAAAAASSLGSSSSSSGSATGSGGQTLADKQNIALELPKFVTAAPKLAAPTTYATTKVPLFRSPITTKIATTKTTLTTTPIPTLTSTSSSLANSIASKIPTQINPSIRGPSSSAIGSSEQIGRVENRRKPHENEQQHRVSPEIREAEAEHQQNSKHEQDDQHQQGHEQEHEQQDHKEHQQEQGHEHENGHGQAHQQEHQHEKEDNQHQQEHLEEQQQKHEDEHENGHNQEGQHESEQKHGQANGHIQGQQHGKGDQYEHKQEHELEHAQEQEHQDQKEHKHLEEDQQQNHHEHQQAHEHQQSEGHSVEDYQHQHQHLERKVEVAREKEVAEVLVDGKRHSETVQYGQVGGSEVGRVGQVEHQDNGGEGDVEKGESISGSGEEVEEGASHSGEEIVDLEGPSGTLGWSDQELGLSSARGLGRIPQGVGSRQLFAQLGSRRQRGDKNVSTRKFVTQRRQQQHHHHQRIKVSQ